MSARKHSMKVDILGESYSIRTEAPPEHTMAVAEHLDRSIRQILSGGSVIEVNRAAILGPGPTTTQSTQLNTSKDSLGVVVYETTRPPRLNRCTGRNAGSAAAGWM